MGKLNNILTLWCSNHNDFIYPYYKKISVTALAKLLQTNHALLAPISFDGYPIINIHAPRSSRWRSKQLEYTKMPFPVKFFQILIDTFRDLVDCQENDEEEVLEDEEEDDEVEDDEDAQEHSNDAESEEEQEYIPEEDENEEESEDDEYEEDEEDDELLLIQNQHKNDNNHTLLTKKNKKMMHSESNMSLRKDIELELCPEAVNDSIFYMEFAKWSKELTQTISNQNGKTFQNIIFMLSDDDKNILRKILI